MCALGHVQKFVHVPCRVCRLCATVISLQRSGSHIFRSSYVRAFIIMPIVVGTVSFSQRRPGDRLVGPWRHAAPAGEETVQAKRARLTPRAEAQRQHAAEAEAARRALRAQFGVPQRQRRTEAPAVAAAVAGSALAAAPAQPPQGVVISVVLPEEIAAAHDDVAAGSTTRRRFDPGSTFEHLRTLRTHG